MFGKGKADRVLDFEAAKEATRRATFLNKGSGIPASGEAKENLATLFRVCRATALKAGAAIGKSGEAVDAEISALCDADVARLKHATEDERAAFTRDSSAIAKAFVERLDEATFDAAAKPVKTTKH